MDTNEGRNHLNDVVDDFTVAMLITHTANEIHARPMAITRLDDGIDAYLVTDIHSFKMDEIRSNPYAVLAFQGASKFASVRGVLTLLKDPELLDKLWKEAWKVWFPDGKSDPNIALLKFTAHEGEYWDNAGLNGLKYAYEAAKAYVAGDMPKTDTAQHATVRLG